MKNRYACFQMVLLAGVLAGWCQINAQPGLPVATVHVEVFGPFGDRIPAPEVRLYTPDRKRDLARTELDTSIPGVPYGQYVLVVSSKGVAVAERELAVNTKDVWVRVGLPFPGGNRAWPGGDLTISGTVTPAPANPNGWWARVDGVFLHSRKESPVSRSGQFHVGGLEMGTYLVQVFENAKLRHVETVEIDTKTPSRHLKISLAQPSKSAK